MPIVKSRWRSTALTAQAIIKAAADKGLRMGCAPDTFLGGGGQTARKAIDDGRIGAPVAATATMDVARARILASQRRFLLSQGRWTALRFWTVSPDGARQFDGSGRASRWAGTD